MRANSIHSLLSAALVALVAFSACEPLGPPKSEVSGPPTAGADEHAAREALGEDAHMVALASEIPGFGGYWYEYDSDRSPGAAGADRRPDGRRLVIALTEGSAGSFPAARQAVLGMLSPSLTSGSREPAPEVVERVVEYSFIELARHRLRLRALFAVPEVVSLGVDEEVNRVVIGLDDPSAKATVLALVTELAVPTEVISFSQRSRVKMLGVSSAESPPDPLSSSTTLTLRGRVPGGRLQGGFQVEADGGGICTLGFTARLANGVAVFVSNSHCSMTPWRTDFGNWGQPVASDVVGYEIEDPRTRKCWKTKWKFIPWRYDCRDSDASMVAVNSDVSISLGRIGKTIKPLRDCTLSPIPVPLGPEHCIRNLDPITPTLRVTSTKSSSNDGDILDKMGSATGWTWGYVLRTCEDVRGDSGVVIECADEVDFPVADGDSGAPVFKFRPGLNTVELRGIVFGMREERAGTNGVHRKGYFQDLEQIERDLGPLTVFRDDDSEGDPTDTITPEFPPPPSGSGS